jgi:hypothetical protein
MLEYVQIKAILNCEFEIVLNFVCKRSKETRETAAKSVFPDS